MHISGRKRSPCILVPESRSDLGARRGRGWRRCPNTYPTHTWINKLLFETENPLPHPQKATPNHTLLWMTSPGTIRTGRDFSSHWFNLSLLRLRVRKPAQSHPAGVTNRTQFSAPAPTPALTALGHDTQPLSGSDSSLKQGGEAVNGHAAGTAGAKGAAATLLCSRREEQGNARRGLASLGTGEKQREWGGEKEDRRVKKDNGYKGKCTQLVWSFRNWNFKT